MKYLMCVGAGIEQVPGIKLAQKKDIKLLPLMVIKMLLD